MGLDNFRSGSVDNDEESKDGDEVSRLFPTVRLISDSEIKEGVKEYVDQEIPGYFWKAPASSTKKYHHKLTTRDCGLWAHTLMLATALEELRWTYEEMSIISKHELDAARAAVLLHDTKKYGDKYWDSKSADRDHDLQAARAVERIDGLPQEVAECIESHMGPSYRGPEPRNHLEMLVHQCDMISSSPNITSHIWKPPEEIKEANSEFETVDNDLLVADDLRD